MRQFSEKEKVLIGRLIENVIARNIPCRTPDFADSYKQVLEKWKQGKLDYSHMTDDDELGVGEIVEDRIISLDTGEGPYSDELKTCYSIVYKLAD